MFRCYDVEAFRKALQEFDIAQYKIVMKGAGKTRKRYYNIAVSFDTEATNMVIEGRERAHTYAMMFSIDNLIEVLVRTWEDTVKIIDIMHAKFSKAILPVYVHNLPFDFCGLSGWLEWGDVFSIAPHTPIRAYCKKGLEFRDSLVLFAQKLETIGEKLHLEKKEMNYKTIRHKETELTEQEKDYCFRDVEIVVEAIKREMQQYDLAHIPMTKTGYVREHIRSHLRQHPLTMEFIQSLKLTEEEYAILKEAFSGGFSHANAQIVDEILEMVFSFDIITSYIATAVCELFPMSCGKKVEVNTMSDFVYYLKNFLSVFPITFYNIRLKDSEGDCPISASKCVNAIDIEQDNGRVYSARRLTTTITNIDLETIMDFYDFETFDVNQMYVYKPGRLPKELVRCMLELYITKTQLKGIDGAENEYNRAKELLNAIYGMMCTDIVQDMHEYKDGSWGLSEPQNAIEKYNENKNRFLFYPWGVFIAAYSRRNLMIAIHNSGKDHVYSDTDSEKFVNADNLEFFKDYNEYISEKMDDAMDFYGFDREMTRPKNKKGAVKQLGAFEYEHQYKKFKTLGSKRYLVQTEDDEVILTIAGTQKQSSLLYMLNEVGAKYEQDKNGKIYCEDVEDLFNLFNEDLVIPAEHTGKMTHKYQNETVYFSITDYTGKTTTVEERGACFLEPASYSLSMTEKYLQFILDVKSHRVRKYF